MRTRIHEIRLFEMIFLIVTGLLLALSIENEIRGNIEELQEMSDGYIEISADTGKVRSVAHMIDEEFCASIMEDENVEAHNGKSVFYLDLSELELIPADLPEPEAEETSHIAKFIGNSDFRWDPNFYLGDFELVEGEYIEPQDTHAVLISEELAEKNHLEIGDSFKGWVTEYVSWWDEDAPGKSFSFVIKGIYRVRYQQKSLDRYTAQTVCENFIFTNIPTAWEIHSCLIGDDVDWYNSSGTFFVGDINAMSETIDRMKQKIDVDWANYKIAEKDERYQKVLVPMEKLSLYLRILIAFETGLCFLVLCCYHTRQMKLKNCKKKQMKKELMILTAASALAMLLAVAAEENIGNLILSRFVNMNADEYMAEWLAALNLKAGVLELAETIAIELLILLIIYGISFARYNYRIYAGKGRRS